MASECRQAGGRVLFVEANSSAGRERINDTGHKLRKLFQRFD
jgi:hypothetical protein